VQWTKNFYKTIKSGNLTDIDLDLYFSFSRPGTKQLYRHLNKRFHGRKQHERYERDLVHLASGHLGMKQSRYLKRNLDQCVTELERHGYVVPEDAKQRYRKVRPGVWRVGFSLQPSHRKSSRGRGVTAGDPAQRDARTGDREIVQRFHELWSGGAGYEPTEKELALARRLIGQHGQETLSAALPRVVKVLRQKWPDCRTFKGVEAYLGEATRPLRERERREETRRQEEQQAEAEARRRHEQQQRHVQLERLWQSLSSKEQKHIQAAALHGHPADVLTRRPSLAHALCLTELAKRHGHAAVGA